MHTLVTEVCVWVCLEFGVDSFALQKKWKHIACRENSGSAEKILLANFSSVLYTVIPQYLWRAITFLLLNHKLLFGHFNANSTTHSTSLSAVSFGFLDSISQSLWETYIDVKSFNIACTSFSSWKLNLPQELLIQFTQQALSLCTSIAVSFVSATKSVKYRLQQSRRLRKKIISAPLFLFTSSVRKRQEKIISYPSTVFAQAVSFTNIYSPH